MELRNYFNNMRDSIKKGMDLLVDQHCDSFGSLANMSHDELEGYKAINEISISLADYVEEHSKMMEEMSRKLDDIQRELKELKINKKGQA